MYIFKIEIRNWEIYLPEVSLSSTMAGKLHGQPDKHHMEWTGVPVEIVFQEQSDSSLHSLLIWVWDHFHGIIADLCGDWWSLMRDWR